MLSLQMLESAYIKNLDIRCGAWIGAILTSWTYLDYVDPVLARAKFRPSVRLVGCRDIAGPK